MFLLLVAAVLMVPVINGFPYFTNGQYHRNSNHLPDDYTNKNRSTDNDKSLTIKCVTNIICLLDRTEGILAKQMQNLLVEADRSSVASGRATGAEQSGSTPSKLAVAVSGLMSELGDGVLGLLLPDDDDEDEAEDDEDDDETNLTNNEEVSSNSNELNSIPPSGAHNSIKQYQRRGNALVEARRRKKKRKKGKLRGLIKLLVVGAIAKAKISLLLKTLSAGLQTKFFLVALAGFILNAFRFYLDLRRGGRPQRVIYFEHAQHQHHYDGGDEEWAGATGPGSQSNSFWGRSYDDLDEAHHQLGNGRKKYQQQFADDDSATSWL